MARRIRARGIWLAAGCAALLAAAFILPHVLPPPQMEENRTLADAPSPPGSLNELDSFRTATDAYVADHFPARGLLISALNRARLWIGVSGSSRVIVGRDGWLFSDDGTHLGAARGALPLAPEAMALWLDGLAGRREALAAQGTAYVVLVAPLKETVYPAEAPAWFELALDRPAALLSRLAEVSGAGAVVYPHKALKRQADWGLKVYSPHDSHWTGLGAYHGYAALMDELRRQGVGEGPRPLDAFVEVRRGEVIKPRDLALMLGVASFVDVDYPEMADPAIGALKVNYLGARAHWTAPRVIDTGMAGKPVLLMTMDSFSNALLPFLYGDFSRIILAHNQDGVWRGDLIGRYAPDAVVTEVIESGLPMAMVGSPPASPAAQARVRQAVADRQRYIETAEPADFVWGLRRRRIEGGADPDRLAGRGGPEDLHGRRGDDTLGGGGGSDALRGGRGRDRLSGGAGADWLSGGRDDDVLLGGPGPDTFHVERGGGADIIEDFDPLDGDRVEIEQGQGFEIRQIGRDTVVLLPGGRLVLRGVRAGDLAPEVIRWR
jgi:hypothetical protein